MCRHDVIMGCQHAGVKGTTASGKPPFWDVFTGIEESGAMVRLQINRALDTPQNPHADVQLGFFSLHLPGELLSARQTELMLCLQDCAGVRYLHQLCSSEAGVVRRPRFFSL